MGACERVLGLAWLCWVACLAGLGCQVEPSFCGGWREVACRCEMGQVG
jgi:hypothetical protein